MSCPPSRPLAGLPSTLFENDDLSYCFKNLTSLAGLSHLTTLTSLNVSFNSLQQLEGIQALPSLCSLNISHNRLISVQELTSLSQTLTQLVCSSNKITSTDALAHLPGLHFLALHNNSISTAASVLALTQLSKLKHLSLRKNPVCKQDNWQAATIAVLPSLQALDSTIITAQQRAAASAHAEVWLGAGQQQYSCSSTPRDSSSAAGSECGDMTSGSATPPPGSARVASRSSNSTGRLRPRVPSAAGQDDNMSIKDTSSMLPSMSLQPLKPSSLVRKPVEAPQPSMYGYSRAKPLKVLQKQTYTASGGLAVLVHSDGSASITWPEGGMAASLDAEEPPPAGSIGSGTGSSTPPIKGYRMLAMYRSITGVAASFDSSGGFVQWPSGQLMLVWDKKDGTAYAPDGRVSHSFTNRRKPPCAPLTEDITAQLDEHFSIRFLAGSYELLLAYECEGCAVVLSQRHGAVLSDRCTRVQQPQLQAGQQQSQWQEPQVTPASQQGVEQQQEQPAPLQSEQGGVAAALEGLPGGDDMQALLARARALMAATGDSEAAALHDPAAAATAMEVYEAYEPASPAGMVSQPAVLLSSSSPGGEPIPCDVSADEDDLQAMMARARAAVAATNDVLQGLALQ